MSTENGTDVAVVEGSEVLKGEIVREKPQWLELRFDTDYLTWDDYALLDGWIQDGTKVKQRDLMALLQKCYTGGAPLTSMPANQIAPAAIELYLALHSKANPGEGEGNSNGG